MYQYVYNWLIKNPDAKTQYIVILEKDYDAHTAKHEGHNQII